MFLPDKFHDIDQFCLQALTLFVQNSDRQQPQTFHENRSQTIWALVRNHLLLLVDQLEELVAMLKLVRPFFSKVKISHEQNDGVLQFLHANIHQRFEDINQPREVVALHFMSAKQHLNHQ